MLDELLNLLHIKKTPTWWVESIYSTYLVTEYFSIAYMYQTQVWGLGIW